MTIPTFEMRNITKRFPGVVANDDVTFAAAPGEIHALLGENGAGKSTLMSILSGLYQPDEGEVCVHGQPVQFHSPRDAIAAGIGMVHQHFMLVESQSVAENVVLGLRDSGFLLRPQQIEEEVNRLGEQYRLPVDPRAKIWQLSVGEQQRVEIIKMLYRGADILLLDEPTAVLTPQEADELFATLHEMTANGKTIVFISHKLDEVLRIADRITVLRGGKVAATVEAAGLSKPELASLMVGREVLFHVEKPPAAPGDVRLALHGVSVLDNKGLPALRGLSLSVRAGEVVGVAGVAGNGQQELADVVAGLRSLTGGTLEVDGRTMGEAAPLTMIRAGVAYVPADRHAVGSAPDLSVGENLALKSYREPKIGGGWWVRRGLMHQRARELVQAYDVATPTTHTRARKLSGGNLQKVILAREISAAPGVLVAAYPTRGLDIGATENVRKLLVEERTRGAGVLLISEDLDEIFALSDRIVVLYEGQIVSEVAGGAAERESVGLMMAGEQPSQAISNKQ